MTDEELQQLSSAVNIISNFNQQRSSPKFEVPSQPQLGKRPLPSNFDHESQEEE